MLKKVWCLVFAVWYVEESLVLGVQHVKESLVFAVWYVEES